MGTKDIKLKDALELVEPKRTIGIYHSFGGEGTPNLLYKGRVKYFHDHDFANHYGEFEIQRIDLSANPLMIEFVI